MNTYIVIPEYGHRDLTIKCVESINKCRLDPNRTTILIADDHYPILSRTANYNDNILGSDDLGIKSSHPKIVANIINWETNVQFAENVNRSTVELSQIYNIHDNDYLFIVNNDTIVRNNAISILQKALDEDNNRIVGPALISSTNKVQHSGHGPNYQIFTEDVYLKTDLSKLPRYPTIISGAFMGMCWKTWKQLGGFDCQRFRAYYEDDDFCIRSIIAGKTPYIVYEAIVEHDYNSTYTNIDNSKTLAIRTISKANFMNKWNPSNIIWTPDGFYSQEEIAKIDSNDDRVIYRESGCVK